MPSTASGRPPCTDVQIAGLSVRESASLASGLTTVCPRRCPSCFMYYDILRLHHLLHVQALHTTTLSPVPFPRLSRPPVRLMGCCTDVVAEEQYGLNKFNLTSFRRQGLCRGQYQWWRAPLVREAQEYVVVVASGGGHLWPGAAGRHASGCGALCLFLCESR